MAARRGAAGSQDAPVTRRFELIHPRAARWDVSARVYDSTQTRERARSTAGVTPARTAQGKLSNRVMVWSSGGYGNGRESGRGRQGDPGETGVDPRERGRPHGVC